MSITDKARKILWGRSVCTKKRVLTIVRREPPFLRFPHWAILACLVVRMKNGVSPNRTTPK